MNITWTSNDDSAAHAEGWGIFAVDDEAHPPFELQADFEAGIFVSGTTADDSAAVAFVVAKAETGSFLHIRALHYIEEHAPAEADHWKDRGLWPLSLPAMV